MRPFSILAASVAGAAGACVMKYGVISDIHSNLEALDSVLDLLRQQGAQAYICCGDLVGYGPDPDACLQRICRLPGLTVVLGNHDLAVLGRMDLEWFNEYARAAVVWTGKRLSEKNRRFLETIPDRQETPTFTVVHGSPRNPAEEYLLSSEQFLANLRYFKVSPCFVGHSHLPIYFAQTKEGRVLAGLLQDRQKLDLTGKGPWILNPGSVGQPRDGDPRASCGLFDSEQKSFRLLRIPYAVAQVQRKMRKAGLPEVLAARLAYGE